MNSANFGSMVSSGDLDAILSPLASTLWLSFAFLVLLLGYREPFRCQCWAYLGLIVEPHVFIDFGSMKALREEGTLLPWAISSIW